MRKNNGSQSTAATVQTPNSKPSSPPETAAAPVDVSQKLLVEAVLTLQKNGIDCETLVRLSLMNLLLRIYALVGKIDAAFAMQPYIPSVVPSAPVNQQRVHAYISNMGQALKLLDSAAELERNTRAIKSERSESEPAKSVGETRP